MFHKIDLYTNTGDPVVLDSLYYLLVDATKNVQHQLIYTEIEQKFQENMQVIQE